MPKKKRAQTSGRSANIAIYEPLKPWQSRLLQLHPGNEDAPLTGDLLISDFLDTGDGAVLHDKQEHVDYEAISYAWESRELALSITLNGRPVGITASLGGALRRFRLAKGTRLLWADALCINQSDDLEKSVQVAKILTVFQRAAMVLIWLGEAGEFTSSTISYLSKKRDHRENLLKNWTLEELMLSRTEHRPKQEEAALEAARHEVACAFEGAKDLLTRPWLRRVWAQQEMFAARYACVHCGDQSFSLDLYNDCRSYVEFGHFEFGDFDREHNIDSSWMQALSQLSSLYEIPRYSKREMSLMKEEGRPGSCYCVSRSSRIVHDNGNIRVSTKPECLLRACTGLRASDDRDRIYALLGITNCRTAAIGDGSLSGLEDEGRTIRPTPSSNGPPESPILTIDYSKSVSEVFQGFMRYIITRDGSLDILRAHFQREESENTLLLPSWCPDWRSFNHVPANESEYESSLRQQDNEGRDCDSAGARYFKQTFPDLETRRNAIELAGFRLATVVASSAGDTSALSKRIKVSTVSMWIEERLEDLIVPLRISSSSLDDMITALQGRPSARDGFVRIAWDCSTPEFESDTSCEDTLYTKRATECTEVSSPLLRVLRVGDVLVQMVGARFPMVLRPLDGERYLFIGPASYSESSSRAKRTGRNIKELYPSNHKVKNGPYDDWDRRPWELRATQPEEVDLSTKFYIY